MAQPWWAPQAHGNGMGGASSPPEASNPQVLGTLYAQPAQFAGALSNNYGSYSQGLGSLGNSAANAYGVYNLGLGNLATARANEASARYGANAMAEAARQASVGNIGSAALGAYGGASNSALGAWAANQQAYNNALSQMHQADQMGLSQYGQGRSGALANLGGAYAGLGRAQVAANALGNVSMNFGGGDGFSAAGTGGPIASGSYGGLASPMGSMSASYSMNSSSGGMGDALAGLNGLQSNLMSPDVLNSMNQNASAGRRQLDAQHSSSRDMPSQMLSQTLGGLLQLGDRAYGQSAGGMDQYYANSTFNESPYAQMAAQMKQGYGSIGDQLGGIRRDLGAGFGAANSGVRNLFDDSLGRTAPFSTPLQKMQWARDADLYGRNTQAADEAASYQMAAADAQRYADQLGPAAAAKFFGRDPKQYIREQSAMADRARALSGMIPTY